MDLKILRQARADCDALQSKLRNEGRTLMAIDATKRTTAQVERLTACEAELDAAVSAMAGITADISRAEKFQADTLATIPRLELGVDHATERPWGPVVAATASPLQAKEAEAIALGNFGLAVMAHAFGQPMDPRLMAAATGAGTQSDSNLGFAVPNEVAPGIERDMFEQGDILGRVDARTVSGNSITYTLLDQTSRADGSRQGGILGYWVDEGVAPTLSNTKLARMEMKLRKVGGLGAMTDELMSDAAALGGELQSAFSEEMVFQVENKIWRGNGAAAPLGFMSAPCLVSVAKETSQPAATITGANITAMWARMPANSHKNAVWLANVDTIPQLVKLSQPMGTAGIVYPFVSITNGQISLWGRPVIFVEYAETLGTQGDIALVDLKRYRLIRKGGVEQASSMHVYFAQGEQAFRTFYRVDGQAVPRAPLTPFKGTATLSPFVVLDTRS